MSDHEDRPQDGSPPEERPATEGRQQSEAKPESSSKDEAAAKAAAAAAKAKDHAAAEAAKDPWERDPVAPEWQQADGDVLADALKESFGEGTVVARIFAGELVLEVDREVIERVAWSLKQDHGFTLLVDICGVHFPDRQEAPFEIVYHLYNLDQERRIRLKVGTQEDVEVPSVTGVWKGAAWPEREVYDMYGVRFAGHPDMTRILMWEGFTGHPLRKDFPVEGIDTGAAIYPEFYGDQTGPVAGTGTGWKPPEPAAGEVEEPSPHES
jgi:NADH-quinone oxidoreductase subunit C